MKAGSKDYLVPFLVVGMLGAMVIPMPHWLLDLLLSFNLAFAVLFLISAIFLQEPHRFTSLPAVLLLSTIFRLSLNISTTRTVLAGGEIPQIVVAFGDFVVGGNIVVGTVVFCIITLVQFLVIAKGAERVAEVAARFTLDAMPGKQMAIDADLRAGAITLVDARSYRRDLQIESKLFGSLDGAMKFVKGDAIAGIVITIVNILAGVFIGCVQQNLSFQEALKKYGIFTIGDGLVSQVPALVIAAAAGIAITRVADQELLGRAIINQLGSNPSVLLTASIVLFVFALIPGIPFFPFFFVATLLAVATVLVNANKKEEVEKLELKALASSAITLKLNIKILQSNIIESLNQIRQKHYEKWGVITPEFDLKLAEDLMLVEYADLEVLNLGKELDRDQLLAKLSNLLEELNPNFINDRHSRILLDINQHYLEDTVNSIIPEMISLTSLTKVLRTLVEENVSIKQLALIIQQIAEFLSEGVFTKASGLNSMQIEGLLVSVARKAMAAQICNDLSKQEISVYKVSEELDQKLSRYAVSPDVLTATLVGDVLSKIEVLAKQENKKLAFVCSKFTRSVLANIIKNESRKEIVISSDELVCKFNIKGELSINNNVVPIKRAA